MSILTIAVLLFAFGLIAQAAGREPSALDRNVMLALRKPAPRPFPSVKRGYKRRYAT